MRPPPARRGARNPAGSSRRPGRPARRGARPPPRAPSAGARTSPPASPRRQMPPRSRGRSPATRRRRSPSSRSGPDPSDHDHEGGERGEERGQRDDPAGAEAQELLDERIRSLVTAEPELAAALSSPAAPAEAP